MLLIWDMHVTSKYVDTMLTELQLFIDHHSDEQTIVFMGDYVYHFNYDRKSLLKVYDFFVDLYESWKVVYVLAWNHDWISGNFVFQEWKRAFDLIRDATTWIHFITEPTLVTIQCQECLMAPYFVPTEETYNTAQYQELLSSESTKEQVSGRINSMLTDMIQARRAQKSSAKLRVFHHWYIVHTQFPWQFARFGYKSPWLSDIFFDVEDIRLISWHLHQPFVHRNYLCIGSIWHTSPLEINQQKFLFSLNEQDGSATAHHIEINPYLHIEHTWSENTIDTDTIYTHIQDVHTTQIKHLQWGDRDINISDIQTPKLEKYSVSIQTEKWYDELQDILDLDLVSQLDDIKIKKPTKSLTEIVKLLDSSSKDLEYRISDRKDLLKQYITQKYSQDADKYLTQLDKMDVIK